MFNVKDDFGAVGNGTNDDTAAIQAAFDTGRNVYIPRGRYKITQGLTLNHDGQKVCGDGITATRLRPQGVSGPAIDIVSTKDVHLTDLRIQKRGAGSDTLGILLRRGPGGASESRDNALTRIRVDQTSNGIEVRSSRRARLELIFLRQLTGDFGLRFAGSQSHPADDLVVDDIRVGVPTNDTIEWIQFDSWARNLVVDRAALVNGGRGIAMVNNQGSEDAAPRGLTGFDLECDHCVDAGLHLAAGTDVKVMTSWIGSTLNGDGVRVTDGFSRGLMLGGGTRIMGNAVNGVVVRGGATDVNLRDLFVGVNSAGAPDVHSGIFVQDARRFQISDCKVGRLIGVPNNPQRFGVRIGRPCRDYIVSGNNLTGNRTAGLRDEGIGPSEIDLNLF